ncbi:MAG: PAS domain S-box protein [Candidatus Thiodiazotropha sp.]
MNTLTIPPQLLLDHLLDATTDTGIAIVDPSLDLMYLNPTAAGFFQCTPEQVLGRSIREHHLSSQRSRERFDRAVEQIRRGEAFEYCIEQSHDGRVRYLGIRVSGLWEAQRLVGYLMIARDITQQHVAELKLAQEQARYRTLYEQAPVPYHSLDADGRIRHVNDAWLDTFGYRAGDIVGQPLSDLLIAPDADVFKRAFLRFKRIGKVHDVEMVMRHADGRPVRILLFGRAVYSDTGQFDHTHCILIDITLQREKEGRRNRIERDAREQQRVHQARQQVQKMEALGQLTGGIAHDFNNILASILGFAELSRMQLELNRTDKLDSYVREIQTAGRRGKSLIDQMLRFSRSDRSLPQPLHLPLLVKEVSKLLRAILPSSIQIDVRVDDGTPPIMADPVQMHQALMNLCINARDAMEGKGVLGIELRFERDVEGSCSTCHATLAGDWVTLSVLDDGPGIPAEIRERVFDPFFTTKAVDRGTGMGLSVVHDILSQHHGHVQLQTRPGQGARFQLLFPPCEETDAQAASPSSHGSIPAPLLTGKVLVVDDEPAVRKVICAFLQHEGLATQAVGDSEAALDLIRQSPGEYDLLVVDQTMPKLTGAELAQQVSHLCPDLPIILCTGHSERISAANIDDFGISRYLGKPVERAALIETVRALLG